MKTALVISANDFLEHDFTLYNKAIFLGETAALIDHQEGWNAVVLDVTYQRLTLSDLIPHFLRQPQLILFYAETNQSRLVLRLAAAAKKASPGSRVLAFGLATTFIPQYFARRPFDAVHVSGDREAAIRSYLQYLDDSIDIDELEGLRLVLADGQVIDTKPGRWLEPAEWPTPALSKLPLHDYQLAQAKRSGVVDCKLGLAITMGKGCETRCNFCGCSEEEGIADRTRKPETIFRWQAEHREYLDDTFHLYGPNVLSKPSWVRQFHVAYLREGCAFSWQGVSRTNTVTEDVVAVAAEAGLRKLSIGIEHISALSLRPIKSSLGELEQAAQVARRHDVSLVGLLMLGYPNQTVADVRFILKVLADLGIESHRFTGYTPLHKLRSMSVAELDSFLIEDYDRRTFYADDTRIPPPLFYEILMSNGTCLS